MNTEHPTPDEPVDFDGLQAPIDHGLRRTVRRALARTAIDAAALTVIMLVVGVLASLFVIQPLLINRSDRAAIAARAAYEAPMLFLPGASVSRFTIASGLFERTVTSEVDIPLGTSNESLEPVISEVGLFGLELEWLPPSPRSLVPLTDVLPGLDPGTVSTVTFDVASPLEVPQAQALVESPGRDVRLIWAGFDVQSSALGRVGYPLCRTLPTPEPELFAASSASAGGTMTGGAPSVEGALESARDALGAIASNDEVATALAGGASGAVESLSELLEDETNVASFVVTGPSPEVANFLDDLGVSEGQVLAVGFYSWGSPLCGR